MNTVAYLTINEETREIVDEDSRNRISSLENQIQKMQEDIKYIAMIMDIDLPSEEE